MASIGDTAPGRFGRVRWSRFVITFIPVVALAVMLVLLSTQAVLAVSLSISGEAFTVTAGRLVGQGFEQFPVVDHSAAKKHISLEATAIRSAQISNLCQDIRVGGLTMVIKAGGGSTPVSATNLVVDADKFSGNATFTHLVQGQDASTLNRVPSVSGPPGAFALSASSVTITNLRQHAYATTAGTFTLPGFSLHFGGGC
jgi:hypothetical protein